MNMKIRTFIISLAASLLAFSAFGAFLSPTNAAPGAWFTNWTENGTNITLPLASLDKLDAAQADGTTGDIRQVVYALLYQLSGTADNATLDAAFTKMSVVKEQQYDRTTGEAIITFSVSFRLTNTVSDVVSE